MTLRRRLYIALFPCLMLLVCPTASAQKINVQYDKSLDFSQYKTFAFAPNDAVSRPMLQTAIVAAIQHDLTAVGLTQVNDNPDLYVKIYGSVDSELSVASMDPLYGSMPGIPPFDTTYNMWGSLQPSDSTAVRVHKGELVVDLLDARAKKLVWRGIAKEKLSEQRSKLLDQVNTAVEKMFQRYPVKRQ